MTEAETPALTVTFAGSGDAFGSGGRYQACIHLRGSDSGNPVLLDCGATSLSALKRLGLDPGEIAAVFVSHLHGDHFGGLPFLILDGQFSRRTRTLSVAGPPGIARRLTDVMECMFPGSSTASRRFGASPPPGPGREDDRLHRRHRLDQRGRRGRRRRGPAHRRGVLPGTRISPTTSGRRPGCPP
jgi:ribonuclease BN (tRNA processing enzyme)